MNGLRDRGIDVQGAMVKTLRHELQADEGGIHEKTAKNSVKQPVEMRIEVKDRRKVVSRLNDGRKAEW